MPAYQVTCVTQDGPDPDFRIDSIGGPNGGTGPGGRWRIGIDDAIRRIEAGGDTFYTLTNGVHANVYVAVHPVSRRKYLTTSPDGYRPNNLLSLPGCGY